MQIKSRKTYELYQIVTVLPNERRKCKIMAKYQMSGSCVGATGAR